MKLHSLFIISSTLVSSVIASCNPLESTDCPADTALASSFKEDFTSESPYFSAVKEVGLSYTDNGLELKLAKRFDNPSIKSNFYIMFGKVEVEMQAAEGKGVISSFYLQSDDLDEIDIELFGGDGYEYQSNFFSKGDTTTYDRGEYHSTSSNPLENFHTYTIDWTKDSITWSVDGTVNRVLKPDNGQGFPQTPMYIMAGVWAGGDPSNAIGTIEWAGGETDYSQAPFIMRIKSVTVTDYSTGEQYSYSDQSGDWTSIKTQNGQINGRYKQAQDDFQKLQNGETVGSKTNFASQSSAEASASASASLPSSSSSSSSSTSSSSSSSSSSISSANSASDSSTSTTKTSSKTSSSKASSSKTSSTKIFSTTASSVQHDSITKGISTESSEMSLSSLVETEITSSTEQTSATLAPTTIITSSATSPSASSATSSSRTVSIVSGNAANIASIPFFSFILAFIYLLN